MYTTWYFQYQNTPHDRSHHDVRVEYTKRSLINGNMRHEHGNAAFLICKKAIDVNIL